MRVDGKVTVGAGEGYPLVAEDLVFKANDNVLCSCVCWTADATCDGDVSDHQSTNQMLSAACNRLAFIILPPLGGVRILFR